MIIYKIAATIFGIGLNALILMALMVYGFNITAMIYLIVCIPSMVLWLTMTWKPDVYLQFLLECVFRTM